MVTICANTETLRPIWADIPDGAGIQVDDDSIGNLWSATVAALLSAMDIDWQYESSFQFWHGGPGHAPIHGEIPGGDAIIRTIYRHADSVARNAAAMERAEILESLV